MHSLNGIETGTLILMIVVVLFVCHFVFNLLKGLIPIVGVMGLIYFFYPDAYAFIAKHVGHLVTVSVDSVSSTVGHTNNKQVADFWAWAKGVIAKIQAFF